MFRSFNLAQRTLIANYVQSHKKPVVDCIICLMQYPQKIHPNTYIKSNIVKLLIPELIWDSPIMSTSTNGTNKPLCEYKTSDTNTQDNGGKEIHS